MQFEPVGGFPPIIRIEDQVDEKTTESRGFVATNIVQIGNIMSNKKKDGMFIAFGSTDDDLEGGADETSAFLYNEPIEYEDIAYHEDNAMPPNLLDR